MFCKRLAPSSSHHWAQDPSHHRWFVDVRTHRKYQDERRKTGQVCSGVMGGYILYVLVLL